ncbi:MAG: caspase family protein [Bacteroidota bacterium]
MCWLGAQNIKHRSSEKKNSSKLSHKAGFKAQLKPAEPAHSVIAADSGEDEDAEPADKTGNRYIKRCALVVACEEYQFLSRLNNPINDGRAMYATLEKAGFKTDTLFNPNMQELNAALILWKGKLKHTREALFYFAGHGLSHGDQNYIVPLGGKLDFTSRETLEKKCLPVQQLVNNMEAARVPIQMLIIDACRDYPVDPAAKDFGSMTLKVNDRRGVGIIYATGAGNKSFDGVPNTNGVFTACVVKHLLQPEQRFNDMVGKIVDEVREATYYRQIPKDIQMSMSTYCFVSGAEKFAVDSSILKQEAGKYKITNAEFTKPEKPVSVPDGVWFNKNKLIEKGDFFSAICKPENAIACFAHAAELGNPEGLYKIGCMCQYGRCVPKDYRLALEFFNKAADLEHIPSVYKAGSMHFLDIYGMVDYENALKHFRLAAQEGYEEAENAIGAAYVSGEGVPLNYTEGIKWYKRAASHGCPGAFSNLGAMYAGGLGVPKDLNEAFKYFTKGAAKGEALSFAKLGAMYMIGNGVPVDYNEARKNLIAGAELGQAAAMSDLGYMFQLGLGMSPNNTEALRWYKKAALQNLPTAIANTGDIYNVLKNYDEAIIWTRKAARLGEPTGQSNYGEMFLLGTGVEQNNDSAYYWFNSSAAKESVWGQWNLAKFYDSGTVVKKDLTKARELFTLAAAGGIEQAKQRLEELAKNDPAAGSSQENVKLKKAEK